MLKMSSTICSSSTPRLRSSATSAATFSGERQRNFLPKMSWQYVHRYGQPRDVKIGAYRLPFQQRHEVPDLRVAVEIDKVPCRQRDRVEIVHHAGGRLAPAAQQVGVVRVAARPARLATSDRRCRRASCRRGTSADRRSGIPSRPRRRRSSRRRRSRRSSAYSDARRARQGRRWCRGTRSASSKASWPASSASQFSAPIPTTSDETSSGVHEPRNTGGGRPRDRRREPRHRTAKRLSQGGREVQQAERRTRDRQACRLIRLDEKHAEWH